MAGKTLLNGGFVRWENHLWRVAHCYVWATSGSQVWVRIPWFLHHGFYPKIAPPSSAKSKNQLIKRRNPANIGWKWMKLMASSLISRFDLMIFVSKKSRVCPSTPETTWNQRYSPSFSGERLTFFVGTASSMKWFHVIPAVALAINTMDHPVGRMENPPATVHAWYPEAIAIAINSFSFGWPS